jgi:hypothetical protein
MEEDNVSDDGAEAGHRALNDAVGAALQEIIDTRSLTNQEVSEAEIQGLTGAIETKIRNAIVDQQNAFENFWSWINADDTIGVKVFIFKHDDLDPGTTQNFSHRWHSEGDWEIFGHITSTPLCPANALNGLFERIAAARRVSGPEQSASAESKGSRESGHQFEAAFNLDAMRQFRDGPYRAMPGLARWFGLAERHVGRVVRLALTSPELRQSVGKMLQWGDLIARQPDAALSREHVEHAERLLAALATHRSRRTRIDARRAQAVLKTLHDKTHREAMEFLAGVPPARRPNVAGNRGARILPRGKDS